MATAIGEPSDGLEVWRNPSVALGRAGRGAAYGRRQPPAGSCLVRAKRSDQSTSETHIAHDFRRIWAVMVFMAWFVGQARPKLH
jgi:hypothetical protein